MNENFGKRLWDQFEEIRLQQSENRLIFQLRITPEEVATLQSVARSFGRFTLIPIGEDIKKYWKEDGLIYLLLFAFAKYAHQTNVRFWEDWNVWTKAAATSELHNPKIYQHIKDFSDKHNLFLYCPNRNEYVGSIKTHAFLGLWTLEKILNALFYIALQYPFHLDQYDRETTLKDALEQIAENPTENAEDDDEQDIAPFQFRKSFRLASFLQKEMVFEELKEIFRLLHNAVLSFVSQKYPAKKRIEFSEPYIQTFVEKFYADLQAGKYEESIKGKLEESKSKEWHFRRPGIYLDSNSMMLKLHVPEQRVFNTDAKSNYSVMVYYGNQRIERILDFRYYNERPYCTREEEIPLQRYHGDLTWKVCRNGVPIKEYRINKKVLYFRNDGNSIELPLILEQELYVLVPEGCLFECDDASKIQIPDTNYSIYSVYCKTDTLLFIDDSFFSPMAQKIPDFMEKKKNVVYKSVKIINSNKDANPVYWSFPGFSIRAKDEKTLRNDYPIWINNIETTYSIEKKVTLCDGTDDFLFDIKIIDPEISGYGVHAYNLKIGCQGQYNRQIIIIPELSFSFTEPLFFSQKDVRVKHLGFDSSETVFSSTYPFPMKVNNTKFRINIEGDEYRIALQPPLIEITIDGKELPKTLWYDDVLEKSILITSEIEEISTETRFSDNSERKLNQLRTANGVIVSLRPLAQDRIVGKDFATISIVCNGSEKVITTIYFKFNFIEGPRFFCNEQGFSQSSFVDREGLYLTSKMIGSEDIIYNGIITYLATGEKHSFPLQMNKGVILPVFITDKFIPNGRCSLEISSEKKLMGCKNGVKKIEYEKEFNKLYDEPVVENIPISIKIDTIIEFDSSDVGFVNNFFLRIDDELTGNDGFLAEGFFLHNKNEVPLTDHNPYTITEIKIDGNKVSCTITDNKGHLPVLDRYGRVNPRKMDDIFPKSINTISGEIIDDKEYTYGV